MALGLQIGRKIARKGAVRKKFHGVTFDECLNWKLQPTQLLLKY